MIGDNRLELLDFSRSPHQLSFAYRCRTLRFNTTIWYPDIDLTALERRFGTEYMDWLTFHIAAFDLNKFASLSPKEVDFGPFEDLVTEELAQLWHQVLQGVWAQWRYQNNRPDDRGPKLMVAERPGGPQAVELPATGRQALVFCGGGKDSLLTLRLLDEAGIGYSSLAYSHAIYGPHNRQHQLIDGLLDHCGPRLRHRMWVQDDFLCAPEQVVLAGTGIRTVSAAETPFSVFASLPIALTQGYRWLMVGHEKSADTPNLIWQATGEAVNHQWGKSLAAEKLLDAYIERHLVTGLRYFSPLKPLSDAVIFPALERFPEAVPATHSCNTDKPWCRHCAKCAYVWLGYAAHLPRHIVDRMFSENLFDVDANLGWYRQLLGLTEATPFECVGQVRESRLAFELCERKGLRGAAIELYRHHRGRDFGPPRIDDLFDFDPNAHSMPPAVFERVSPILADYAAAGRRSVAAALSC